MLLKCKSWGSSDGGMKLIEEKQLCAPEKMGPVLKMINGVINEDVTYSKSPLDLRNQRCYAVRVSHNPHPQNLTRFQSLTNIRAELMVSSMLHGKPTKKPVMTYTLSLKILLKNTGSNSSYGSKLGVDFTFDYHPQISRIDHFPKSS